MTADGRRPGPARSRPLSAEQRAEIAELIASASPGGEMYERAVARREAREELEDQLLRLALEAAEPPRHPPRGVRAAWRALFG
jgi:hypothetical protein